MSKNIKKLAEQIQELDDTEKLELLDALLRDLDKPDPEIDRVWATEARKRWAAYKAGRIATVAYETALAKHRRS
jgi:hypothetical protein